MPKTTYRQRLRNALDDATGNIHEVTCSYCSAEIMREHQFCQCCGKPNKEFSLVLFNQDALVMMDKEYLDAEHARAICADVGEGAVHENLKRHSRAMLKADREKPRIKFCENCGKRIL